FLPHLAVPVCAPRAAPDPSQPPCAPSAPGEPLRRPSYPPRGPSQSTRPSGVAVASRRKASVPAPSPVGLWIVAAPSCSEVLPTALLLPLQSSPPPAKRFCGLPLRLAN